MTFLQIDFNKESLARFAERNNFDFARPTAVVWEGVTNYLTTESIGATFSFVSRFAAGSCVIFTYVHRQVLVDPKAFFGGEKLLKDLEKLGEGWTFGFLPSELPAYRKQFGLTLVSDLGANEYRSKYLTNNKEKGYEFYRVAVAERVA